MSKLFQEKASTPQPVSKPTEVVEEKKSETTAEPALSSFKTLPSYSFDQEGKVLK